MKCSFVVSCHNDCICVTLFIVVFTGNTAPYHITQPSTDNDVQIYGMPFVTKITQLFCNEISLFRV